jgi:hypothetical protein
MIEDNCRFIFVYDNERPVGFASFGPTEPGIFKLHKIYILLINKEKERESL